jgi:hypothetical protein
MTTASGFAQVSMELKHSLMSRSAWVVFGVDPLATDPVVVAQAVVTSLAGAGSFLGLLDLNATVGRVRVSLGGDGVEDVIGEVTANAPGLASQTSVPPNVSVLAKKNTARGGRRGRGRMYIPWAVATSSVDESGVILSATLTTLQSKASAWLTALNTNAVPMVLLHKPGISALGPPNPVTALTLDNRVATQRRRIGR